MTLIWNRPALHYNFIEGAEEKYDWTSSNVIIILNYMTVNKAIIICQSIVSPLSLAAKQLKRSRLDRAAQNSQPIKGFPFDQSEGAVYYFFGSLQLKTSVSFVVSLAIFIYCES